MSIYYGALELKASYQRNLGEGLFFSIIVSVTIALLFSAYTGRALKETTIKFPGRVEVIPYPKPMLIPPSPASQRRPKPELPRPKAGVLMADSFLAELPENLETKLGPAELLIDGENPGSAGEGGPPGGFTGDTVVDLDLDGLKPVILHKIVPVYPAMARQLGMSETIIAEIVVGTDGLVREVFIRKKSTGVFDEEVEAALRQWIFKPLVVDGRVVRFRYLEVVRFTLR